MLGHPDRHRGRHPDGRARRGRPEQGQRADQRAGQQPADRLARAARPARAACAAASGQRVHADRRRRRRRWPSHASPPRTSRPSRRPASAPKSLTNGTTNWTTSVVGTTPAWLPVRARTRDARAVPHRRPTTPRRAAVVVLGPTTASELFGSADPVGQIGDDRRHPVHGRRRARLGRLGLDHQPRRPGHRAAQHRGRPAVRRRHPHVGAVDLRGGDVVRRRCRPPTRRPTTTC